MFTSTPPICTGRALELSRKDSNIRYLRHLGNSDIARFTTERQGYQVLTPFGKLGHSPFSQRHHTPGVGAVSIPTKISSPSARGAHLQLLLVQLHFHSCRCAARVSACLRCHALSSTGNRARARLVTRTRLLGQGPRTSRFRPLFPYTWRLLHGETRTTSSAFTRHDGVKCNAVARTDRATNEEILAWPTTAANNDERQMVLGTALVHVMAPVARAQDRLLAPIPTSVMTETSKKSRRWVRHLAWLRGPRAHGCGCLRSTEVLRFTDRHAEPGAGRQRLDPEDHGARDSHRWPATGRNNMS